MDFFDISYFFRHPELCSRPEDEYGWWAGGHARGMAAEDAIYPPEWACWVLNHVGLIVVALLVVALIWHRFSKPKGHAGTSHRWAVNTLTALPLLAAALYAEKMELLARNGFCLEELTLELFFPLTAFVVFLLFLEGYLLQRTPRKASTPAGGEAVGAQEVQRTEESPWGTFARWTCLFFATASGLAVVLPIVWMGVMAFLLFIVLAVLLLIGRR